MGFSETVQDTEPGLHQYDARRGDDYGPRGISDGGTYYYDRPARYQAPPAPQAYYDCYRYNYGQSYHGQGCFTGYSPLDYGHDGYDDYYDGEYSSDGYSDIYDDGFDDYSWD